MPGVINTPGGPTQQKDHIMCPNFEIISDLSTSDTFLLHFRVKEQVVGHKNPTYLCLVIGAMLSDLTTSDTFLCCKSSA